MSAYLHTHKNHDHKGEPLMEEKSAPVIFDTSDGQQLRINTVSTYLKKKFGKKTVKLSIDGGFTCPNRDGSKGTGGCVFCSSEGSGDMADGSGDIKKDLENQIALLSRKWPDCRIYSVFSEPYKHICSSGRAQEKVHGRLKSASNIRSCHSYTPRLYALSQSMSSSFSMK